MSKKYAAVIFVTDEFMRDSAIPHEQALIHSAKARAQREGFHPLDEGGEVEELIPRPGMDGWEHAIPEGCRAFRVVVQVRDVLTV